MNERDRSATPTTAMPAINPPLAGAPKRASARFMLQHPAHCIALGFGSGLSPVAPGTAGTLWGWLAYLLLIAPLGPRRAGVVIAVALLVGLWAQAVTARNLATADPGSIVWDEIVAFWLMLWLITPASLGMQAAAFALFRLLDAWKPGPIGWVDALFHKPRWATPASLWWWRSLGILADDIVAAGVALLLMALWLQM
jgi:phosphatidylglycerophosphatase A